MHPTGGERDPQRPVVRDAEAGVRQELLLGPCLEEVTEERAVDSGQLVADRGAG
jgi:hypothetical protein